MIDSIANPPNFESTHLRYLNTCFESWGDLNTYRWCFERQVGNLKADVMILKSDETIIAGSAVTYRPVILANHRVNVGIMSGSWTLPEARGRGCFTRIIEESVKLATEKGAAFLLAFVTESNASFRRLSAAGSALFPTHYFFSTEQTPMPQSTVAVSPVTNWDQGADEILERWKDDQSGTAHFTYTTPEWCLQFLRRPGEIEFLTINDHGFAVVEKKNEFDRILVLSPTKETTFADCAQALLKRAMSQQRRLFLFTTSLLWKEQSLKLGLGHAPGFLATLITNKNMLVQIYPGTTGVPENISHQFHEISSPWFVGNWDIQSGDRM